MHPPTHLGTDRGLGHEVLQRAVITPDLQRIPEDCATEMLESLHHGAQFSLMGREHALLQRRERPRPIPNGTRLAVLRIRLHEAGAHSETTGVGGQDERLRVRSVEVRSHEDGGLGHGLAEALKRGLT